MQQVYTLSHTDALKVIDTIRQELDKQQLGAAVAVVLRGIAGRQAPPV